MLEMFEKAQKLAVGPEIKSESLACRAIVLPNGYLLSLI